MKFLCPLLLLVLWSCGGDSDLPPVPERPVLTDVETRVKEGINAAYDQLVDEPSVANFENYGELLHAHGMEEAAFRIWEDLIKTQGSNFRREYLAGRAMFKTAPDKARPHFEAARKLDPSYSALNICLAEIYENDGELDQAESLLLEVGGQDRSGTVPFALGRIAFKNADYERALRKLDEARKIAPDHRPLINLYIQALSRLDRADEAEELTRKLQGEEEEGATVSLKIDDPLMREVYRRRLSFIGLMQKAEAAMHLGQHKQAADIFREIYAEKPDDLDLRNFFAECLQKAGELEEARTHFKKSLEIKPEQPTVVYMLGLAEFQLNNIDEGIRRMNQVRAMQPDNLEPRLMLATALWKTDPRAATHHLRFIILKDPDHLKARLILARIHFEAGRQLEGEAELNRALEIDPRSTDALDLKKRFMRS